MVLMTKCIVNRLTLLVHIVKGNSVWGFWNFH